MHLRYSVVIPLYNEAGNLTRLDVELRPVLATLDGPSEVIYINDGSSDASLAELKTLKGATIIDLNRNYGQATALDAGFKAARGEIVISLDADGQNDPTDIPALLKKMQEDNLDVVAGWRTKRHDVNSVRFITRAARFLRHLFIGDIVHDSGCTLRVYKAEAIKSLDIGGEMHRYILALLKWKGFRIGEMAVTHRPRTVGESKYGPSKALRGFIDLLYVWFLFKYSQRPLHLFGYLGVASLGLGILAGLYSLYGKIVLGIGLSQNGWFLISLFSILACIVFLSFGVVIDLLMQIRFNTSKNEARYYVREVIEL